MLVYPDNCDEFEGEAFRLNPTPNLLTIGNVQPSDSLFSFHDSSKQIGHITPDGQVVVDATLDELEQMTSSPDVAVRGWAIVFRELVRLRERCHTLEHAFDESLRAQEDGGMQWCKRTTDRANELLGRTSDY